MNFSGFMNIYEDDLKTVKLFTILIFYPIEEIYVIKPYTLDENYHTLNENYKHI